MATENTKGPNESNVECYLSVCDTRIEQIEARTDLLLANLEERYYRLLRDLHAREKALRETLYALDKTGGAAPGVASSAARLLVLKSTEEMKLALSRANYEFGLIYSEIGDVYVASWPTCPDAAAAQAGKVEIS